MKILTRHAIALLIMIAIGAAVFPTLERIGLRAAERKEAK